MPVWIIATLAAALVQTLRFSLQKRLRGLGLSTGGATFSRFLFAAPIAVVASAGLIAASGRGMPAIGPDFWAFAAVGGLAQIVATFCTVALFSYRSFAVGIAFTKTETIQVALFSLVVLGERVSLLGLAAIVLASLGVMVISLAPHRRPGSAEAAPRPRIDRAMLLGLAAGGLFGISAVGYRGATLAIDSADPFLRAALALACVTAFQTLAMTGWLAWREAGELTRVLRTWRATVWVGITGVLGSFGWFTAFALENAAYVRSVGQIDLVFSFLISVLVFRETFRWQEALGSLAILAGIWMIVLGG